MYLYIRIIYIISLQKHEGHFNSAGLPQLQLSRVTLYACNSRNNKWLVFPLIVSYEGNYMLLVC